MKDDKPFPHDGAKAAYVPRNAMEGLRAAQSFFKKDIGEHNIVAVLQFLTRSGFHSTVNWVEGHLTEFYHGVKVGFLHRWYYGNRVARKPEGKAHWLKQRKRRREARDAKRLREEHPSHA